MAKSNNQVRRLTMMALFIAIQIIMNVTPIGYLRIGVLAVTLMHIPVIIAAVVLGWKEGAILGLIFGFTSVWNATMEPGITSFVFSPFVTVGGFQGGWQSLIIALVPRVLLGVIAGKLYDILNPKCGKALAAGIAAGIATFCHTAMVLGLIIVFYSASYSAAIGIAESTLLAVMGSVVVSNGIPECAVAVIASMAIRKAYTK